MTKLQLTVLAALLSLLVTLTQSAVVPGAVRSLHKRQSADVRTAEYLAWIALGGRLPSKGCLEVACGVVDVFESGKKKRSGADEEDRYQLLRSLITRAALENSEPTK